MKQQFYYFIFYVALLFVSLRSGAATNNAVEKLLDKAKQELYSNPRQSAYCSSKVQEIAFSDDQRVRAFLLYAQAEEMLGDFDGCLQDLFKADRLISKTDTQLRGALYDDQRVRAFLLYAQAEEMLGDFDGCLQDLFKADRLISKTDTQLRGALYNQMSG